MRLLTEHPSRPFRRNGGRWSLSKTESVILLYSLTLIAASLSCGLLNLLVFNSTAWSLYIIGACVILWVAAIPIFMYTRLPVYFSLLLDGLAVSLYEYLITFNTPYRGMVFRPRPSHHGAGNAPCHADRPSVPPRFLFLSRRGAVHFRGDRRAVRRH